MLKKSLLTVGILGAVVAVDMEISVHGGLSVEEGHRIAHSVEEAVTVAYPSVREVTVHVNPWQPSKSPLEG